jgi:putative FmdB family regulatory protein
MPLYEYVCDACGPFAAMRPLAAFAEPCACPDCGAAAPRDLLASPALGGGATTPGAASAPKTHVGGCACCKPRRGLRADGVGRQG